MTDTPETNAAEREKIELSREWSAAIADIADDLRSKLAAVTEQRDRLATILQNIRSGYGGQIPDPTCDCGDCEFLIKIDNALQYLTNKNEI